MVKNLKTFSQLCCNSCFICWHLEVPLGAQGLNFCHFSISSLNSFRFSNSHIISFYVLGSNCYSPTNYSEYTLPYLFGVRITVQFLATIFRYVFCFICLVLFWHFIVVFVVLFALAIKLLYFYFKNRCSLFALRSSLYSLLSSTL